MHIENKHEVTLCQRLLLLESGALILNWRDPNSAAGVFARCAVAAAPAACGATGSANCRGHLQTLHWQNKRNRMMIAGTDVVAGSHSMGEVDVDQLAQTRCAVPKRIERRVQKDSTAGENDSV